MNSTFLWMVSVANRWKESAAVTVQKSAHRILLYSFMHDPSQSPPPSPRVPLHLPTGMFWTR